MTHRDFYAEEIEAACGLRTPALARAFAAVPRERFLGPGPWTIKGEGDRFSPPRQTPDADPRRVYHNVAIYSAMGIRDPGREPALGQAMRAGDFMAVRRLRRDPHDSSPDCWLHGPDVCLSRS